ncbi:MAG TPA: tRNA (adenine-N1)-methyltransferase, partial [Aeromicrobium sp.]|nr:tRNA (adenine-N1)-methyltransferase [Aeromicrobium sp.]
MTRPLEAGEWVRLSDAKGRRHNLRLEAGREFSTKKGQIKHDELIGQPEGTVVTSSLGGAYQVFRPLLNEYVVSMPRGAAIVYPKDAAQIVTMADVFPGARVVEAGAGSGSLTLYLLRAVGSRGNLHSYEMRADFAEIARANVEQVAGARPPNWTLTVGDVREVIAEDDIDRLILDMVDPWTCVPMAAERLTPGGIICAYVATTTQLSLFVETLRAEGGF